MCRVHWITMNSANSKMETLKAVEAVKKICHIVRGKKSAKMKKKQKGKAKAPDVWDIHACDCNEHFFLAKAFIAVSCSAKHSTDKQTDYLNR